MEGIGKKKDSFLDYFFYRSTEAGSSAYIFARLQYSYELSFTMSTYLCIQCAQSFALEHYFAVVYSKNTSIEMRQRAFLGAYQQDQLLLNIFVANVKLDFETY